MNKIQGVLSIAFFFNILVNFTKTEAQILPDNSLGKESSIVVNEKSKKIITGGAERGSNLFHSFKEFNVKELDNVYFSPANNIQNIFTRVTGGNSSQISGKLGVIGNSNLYLINPKGIIFGASSSLDLKGSFIVTTADKIIFADGKEFSASSPGENLLTINVPIGLGFSGQNGAITINGKGHGLNYHVYQEAVNLYYPVIEETPYTNLSVLPGSTLALLGGEINLNGGVVKAPGGILELASIDKGVVKLEPNSIQGAWKFNYEGVKSFKNITLLAKSGVIGNQGIINVHSNIFSILEGSTLLNQQLTQPAGKININAFLLKISGGKIEPTVIYPNTLEAQIISLSGVKINDLPLSTNIFTPSVLTTENLSNFSGANIEISAKKVIIENGSQLNIRNFNTGQSGNIAIKSESIENSGSSGKIGFVSSNVDINSFLGIIGVGKGSGGDLQINGKKVIIKDGANIASIVLGSGSGGNIELKLTESIQVTGISIFSFLASSLGSVSLSQGDSGEFQINAPVINVEKGGAIYSSAYASGNAGKIIINAQEIQVKNGLPVEREGIKGVYYSQISSAVEKLPPALENVKIAFNLPEITTGNAGDILINAENLKISNEAIIGIQNQGTGNGGKVTINVSNLSLSNNGRINATTLLGQGGDIKIKSSNLTINQSQITATAGNQGNGGNIDINTDVLIGLNNNQLIANAFQGKGGNIKIVSQGVFTSPNTQIAASSQLGIDGQVRVTVFKPIESALNQLSVKLISPQVAIASSCLGIAKRFNGTFTVNGTGVVPLGSQDEIYSGAIMSAPTTPDQAEIVPLPQSTYSQENLWPNNDSDLLQEGTILVKEADGSIALKSDVPQINYSFCKN